VAGADVSVVEDDLEDGRESAEADSALMAELDLEPGHRDYVTAILLAAGLARIRQVHSLMHAGADMARHASALLPVPWRSGATRVWWRYYEAGMQPPESDLELMRWCRTPFGDWKVPLRLSGMDLETSLIGEDGDLTEFAEQAAHLAIRDVEAELVENQVYRELMLTADANGRDEAGAQAAYVYLRCFLTDRAVISDLEVSELKRKFKATGLNGQPYVVGFVNAAYERHPAQGTVSVLVCAGCGNPLTDRAFGCGTPGCNGGVETLDLRTLGAYYVQHRGTRRFMHDPGLVEKRIREKIREMCDPACVTYIDFPGRDAYDGAAEFYDPRLGSDAPPVDVWGCDAKDQASATLLGIRFRWKPEPPCRRKFLVVAQHRANQPGYLEDLRVELHGRVSGIEVVSEERFTQLVANRAQEVAGS